MEIIPAPDFPTGGMILGRSGARKAYLEGRGSVIIRAKTRIEEIRKDRFAIIIDEIPYQVNKATMIENIAELVREKKIEGIAHVAGRIRPDRRARGDRAEARRDAGRGAEPALPLHADADVSFGCNMLALNGGRPEQLTLRDFLTLFHHLPRGSCRPPHRLRTAQGARAQPHPLRPGRGGVERGRGGGDHPRLRRPGRGARAADDAALAGGRHRRLHPADRRSDPHGQRGRHLQPVRNPGPRDPRPAPAAPDRAGRQGSHRRACRIWPPRSGITSTSWARATGSWRSSRTSCAR